jgi:hypothetical protein
MTSKRGHTYTSLERDIILSSLPIVPSTVNMNPSNIYALALAAETRPKIQVKQIVADDGKDGSAAESNALPRAASSAPPERGNRKPNFAEKLYDILADKDKRLSPIITWLPSGKSFCIMDRTQFTNVVLPLFFKECKFESFSRRLKRWGFKKAYSAGQKRVVITHYLFQKDRPDLCKMMNGRANQSSHATAQVTASKSVTDEKKDFAKELTLAEKSLLAHKAKVIQPYPKSSQAPLMPPHHPSPVMASFVPTHAYRPYDMNHMHEMPMMNYAFEEANSSVNPWYSSFARNQMVAAADADVLNQMSTVNQQIAECEEQLVILHRLRALREKRRILG